jgi:hypothetical protein
LKVQDFSPAANQENQRGLAAEGMFQRHSKTLVAPQGFEPRSSESESLVLPLNEGAINTGLVGSCRLGGSHNQPPL